MTISIDLDTQMWPKTKIEKLKYNSEGERFKKTNYTQHWWQNVQLYHHRLNLERTLLEGLVIGEKQQKPLLGKKSQSFSADF